MPANDPQPRDEWMSDLGTICTIVDEPCVAFYFDKYASDPTYREVELLPLGVFLERFAFVRIAPEE